MSTPQVPTPATPQRPAAYIRCATAMLPDSPDMQRSQAAARDHARALGWPEPAIYADSGTVPPGSLRRLLTVSLPGPAGPLIARMSAITAEHQRATIASHRRYGDDALTSDDLATDGAGLTALAAAISAGHHDAVLIAGPGPVSDDPADVTAFLAYCDNHHTPVHNPASIP